MEILRHDREHNDRLLVIAEGLIAFPYLERPRGATRATIAQFDAFHALLDDVDRFHESVKNRPRYLNSLVRGHVNTQVPKVRLKDEQDVPEPGMPVELGFVEASGPPQKTADPSYLASHESDTVRSLMKLARRSESRYEEVLVENIVWSRIATVAEAQRAWMDYQGEPLLRRLSPFYVRHDAVDSLEELRAIQDCDLRPSPERLQALRASLQEPEIYPREVCVVLASAPAVAEVEETPLIRNFISLRNSQLVQAEQTVASLSIIADFALRPHNPFFARPDAELGGAGL